MSEYTATREERLFLWTLTFSALLVATSATIKVGTEMQSMSYGHAAIILTLAFAGFFTPIYLVPCSSSARALKVAFLSTFLPVYLVLGIAMIFSSLSSNTTQPNGGVLTAATLSVWMWAGLLCLFMLGCVKNHFMLRKSDQQILNDRYSSSFTNSQKARVVWTSKTSGLESLGQWVCPETAQEQLEKTMPYTGTSHFHRLEYKDEQSE